MWKRKGHRACNTLNRCIQLQHDTIHNVCSIQFRKPRPNKKSAWIGKTAEKNHDTSAGYHWGLFPNPNSKDLLLSSTAYIIHWKCALLNRNRKKNSASWSSQNGSNTPPGYTLGTDTEQHVAWEINHCICFFSFSLLIHKKQNQHVSPPRRCILPSWSQHHAF